MNTDLKQTFVELLGEGTEVYRPIQVEPVENGRYLIIGPDMPSDETWAFPLGSIVTLSEVTTSSGNRLLVASVD
jgi:hypothetical protein